jgi:predicted nuclease of predicted toxin-antitoxin system
VKFLVDAQLPLRLCRLLIDGGHDVIHTSQLPNGNATPDGVIIQIADGDARILISKDRDFEIGHLLRGAPASLQELWRSVAVVTPCRKDRVDLRLPIVYPGFVDGKHDFCYLGDDCHPTRNVCECNTALCFRRSF